mmetsp:Transcript_27281/g.64016  ORF Transcript_27281/g.64016 Transcript_27281/m.64016 type:complete len:417 (+) Transcript_27281:3-1253(+)
MTEFRRASGAVEAIEKLVADLVGQQGSDLSDEARSKFNDLQKQLADLAPTAEKMRRKCEARGELEIVKAQMREHLPGAPEDALKAAQEAVDKKAEGVEALKPLLDKALELDGVATYGAKMVEKVLDLLGRLDAAQATFKSGIVPRFGAAVESADAAEAARREAAERAAAAAAEEEARRAAEEARKPIAGLLSENEQRLRELREAEEEAERQRAEKEEAERRAEAAREAEEEALQRAQEEGERRLAEVGPDAACGEALVAMLAAPVGRYRAAVDALHGMLGGIAAEPSDVSLRLARVANEGFQERLGRRPGVWLFLRGVGFEPHVRDALPKGLLGSLGIGPGPPTEPFLLLKEPDMFNAYEEWLAWHERIKAIAGFLQALQQLAFQRVAHLGQHGMDVAARTALSASEVQQRWEART